MRVGSTVAILADPVVDAATAGKEHRVCFVQDPPHDRIEQAHGTPEDPYPFRPLTGALICP